jgi:hypothetical protein
MAARVTWLGTAGTYLGARYRHGLGEFAGI